MQEYLTRLVSVLNYACLLHMLYSSSALTLADTHNRNPGTPENKALVKRARDYVLKSIDGFRHDIRSNLRPSKVHDRIQKGMKKDKSGTTGLGTGAFLGLVL